MTEETLSPETAASGQVTPAPAATPENTSGQQPAMTENSDTTVTSDTGDDSAADTGTKKSKQSVQERINKITKQRSDAERDRDYWKERYFSTQNGEQGTSTKPNNTKPQTETDELDPNQFDSYEAFETARHQKIAKKVRAEEISTEQTQTKVQDAIKKGQEEFPDFNDVVFDPEVSIAPHIFHAVLDLENSARVFYHLGQNPDLALRISQMSPLAAGTELGRISAKLAVAASPVKPSSAPPPVPTLGGRGTPAPDPKKMSTSDYRKWRQAHPK
jgi:hypothetical protein